jgi:hypothetical protein
MAFTSYDPNDITTLMWLGKQDMSVIMELLALPGYLEKPPQIVEDITLPAKFDYYF